MENNSNRKSQLQMRAVHLLECLDATSTMYIDDISRLFECYVNSAAERGGVSTSYRKILFHLAHEDGLTQLDLVKRSHLTAPTVSVAIKKMENEGFVIRKADKEDMRQVRVYLTEKGKSHDEFIRRISKEIEEKFLSCLSDEEVKQLNGLLRRVLENIVRKE